VIEHPMSRATDHDATTSPTAPVRMTYEEFLRRHDGHAEWVEGEVIVMSPTSRENQQLADFLTAILTHFVEAHDRGIILSSRFQMKTEARLAGREPDVLFLAEENRGRLRENFLDGPADLAVEIVSPDSVTRDRVEKYREYEAGGVREYWLIDPAALRAEFFGLMADGRYRPLPVEGDGVFRSVVLPGLWLTTGWLWRRPPLMDVLKAWGLV
jgi:Uma2 family endonuclease